MKILRDKFIVAYVTNVREEGIAPLSQVRSDVEMNVRRQKKADRIRLASSFRSRANYEAFEALKKAAEIVDKRSKFY